MVFLGFAFHPLNVDLLLPADVGVPKEPASRKIFGTAFHMSDSDKEVVLAKLNNRLRGQVTATHLRNDLKCAALFQEYSQSLSMVY